MAKTISISKLQEWKALDRISPIVHEMPSIFREIAKDDFGIDGEIEVLIPKADGEGFETTGSIIKVQAKSGASYVKQDSETGFSTPVNKDDLELWYNATHPVILIVYHPKDDKLYWKEVKGYIQSTPNVFQPPLRIVFDKTTDEFTPACHKTVCDIAAVSPPRVSRQDKERLFSNLLLIRRMPGTVWSAPTNHQDYSWVKREIRNDGGFVPPFCIIGSYIHTLSDLNDDGCTLRSFCDTEKISSQSSVNWWNSQDSIKSYVSMLNRLLRIHIYRCGLKYSRDFHRYYFPRENDSDLEFKRAWYNARTKKQAPERIVAKFYEYGIDQFWRHTAADLRFRMIGSSWFLQIIPKYFFTIDGEMPIDPDKVGPYTTKLKALERNPHVLNHILFWSHVLSQDKPDTKINLDFKPVMIIEKLPFLGIADFAIPYDPAIYEEPPPVEQLSMFEHWFGESDEDEDEY
jgi:hypothetical protein